MSCIAASGMQRAVCTQEAVAEADSHQAAGTYSPTAQHHVHTADLGQELERHYWSLVSQMAAIWGLCYRLLLLAMQPNLVQHPSWCLSLQSLHAACDIPGSKLSLALPEYVPASQMR